MKNYRFALTLGILCLTAGFLIYTGTRSDLIYINQWTAQIGDGEFLLFIQNAFQGINIPYWIRFSLPDGLWMLALITLVLYIWDFKIDKNSLPWLAGAVVSGVLFEVFQNFQIVPGTFDFLDLYILIIAACIPLSFTFIKYRSCNTN